MTEKPPRDTRLAQPTGSNKGWAVGLYYKGKLMIGMSCATNTIAHEFIGMWKAGEPQWKIAERMKELGMKI